MRQPKAFLYACLVCAVPLVAQNPVKPSAQPNAQASNEQAIISAAFERSKEHQDAAALSLFSQALAQDPNNAAVNLLAAGSAIESLQMDLALKYAQKAQQLDPADWKVHLTLLVADAGTGKLKERDQERELVRQFHSDGKHPDATQSNGFMIDYFALKDYRVRAVEYFAPMGTPHFSYRFLVYNQDRKQLWTVALESDDLDQASWATAHKALAANGEREYSLDGYGANVHTTYRDYSGKPSYDEVKAEVVKVMNEQPLPNVLPAKTP
jgi:tetratricopeptide (TPR) repeat protein